MKGFSTIDHIFTLKCLLDIYLSKGQKIYACFIDYAKAFDSVWRVGLWKKLLDQGIDGKVIRIIMNMYEEAKSCVKSSDGLTNFFKCETGVRQGENLSPFLFAIFLNDLERFLEDSGFRGLQHLHMFSNSRYVRELGYMLKMFILLYADDTILLADSPEELQKGLDSMNDYCSKWKLNMNKDKTKVMIFSRGKSKKEPPVFKIGNNTLEIVDKYCYLGVLFNYNGSLSSAVEQNAKKGVRAMFSLLRRGRELKLSFKTQIDLFDQIVAPVLTYGCEVWGYEKLDDIFAVQKKFYKYMLKLSTSTPTAMVLGEVGKFPIGLKVRELMIGYWTKLINEVNSKKWNVVTYNIIKELSEGEYVKSEWFRAIKNILTECNKDNVLSDANIDKDRLKKAIRDDDRRYYIERWEDELNSDPRCCIYKTYKNEFKCEEYMQLLPNTLGWNFAKMRLSNLNSDNVRNRMYGSTVQQIEKCQLCDKVTICDELHYIVECEQLSTERKKCEPILKELNDLKALKVLLSDQNIGVGIFCKQVNKALKGKRKSERDKKE